MDPSALSDGISLLFASSDSWSWLPFGATWFSRLGNVAVWEWAAIAFCLFFSAIYSASETSLTALSQAKIQQMLETDPTKYKMFSLWLERPNHVLTAILIGNNLVNILASALATSIAEEVFLHSGVAIAVGVMTLLILINGEIVPKTYAKYHAKQVARRLFPILRLSYLLFYPVTMALTQIASWVVRLFGGRVSHSGPFVSEADIEYIIDLGTREGVLNEEKEKLLQSILEFDDITIREVMVPRTEMLSISVEAQPDDVLELANNSPHSRIPVYLEHLDNVEGILYLRDLFRMYTANGESLLSSQWTDLLRPAYFVPGTMKISTLLGEFQRRKKHIAIVVDEFGGTMGLVTMEDILEEIVGEIRDEFDTDEQHDFVVEPDGTILAQAKVGVRDLEEELEIEFPDEGDYETLGGFLTACSGHVPEVGHVHEYEGFLFTVLEANEKSVQSVAISRAEIEFDSLTSLSPESSDSLDSQENQPVSEEKGVA
ncbi:MAG: HlyC/CorC family transporter [Deltaproteobacteria bacterium]|nr:MAG: HlyC/CorC family transporter [Deltaproteobacteria bacterium]